MSADVDDIIKPPPKAGSGVHPWLFGQACRLKREGVSLEEAPKYIQASLHKHPPGRDVSERELNEAVRNAFAVEGGRFFRQGSVIVELVECSEGSKLVELTVEAFRSRLDTHFTLRSVAMLNGQEVVREKRCSQDNAKTLLETEAALKHLPPIQAVVNSPVFGQDEAGRLTVLNQGYHACNGRIYVLRKRDIDTTIKTKRAIKALLGIFKDFLPLTDPDKSRCVAGLISPALRFGRLLDADFPLDL